MATLLSDPIFLAVASTLVLNVFNTVKQYWGSSSAASQPAPVAPTPAIPVGPMTTATHPVLNALESAFQGVLSNLAQNLIQGVVSGAKTAVTPSVVAPAAK